MLYGSVSGLIYTILLAVIIAIVIYGVYKLALFVMKVNKFIDEQERKSKIVKMKV